MRETSIVTNLLREVEAMAADQDAERVVAVTVRLGARAGITPARLRERFIEAARDSLAEDATLEIIAESNPSAPTAEHIRLEGIEAA